MRQRYGELSSGTTTANPTIDQLKSFYKGPMVKERMEKIRNAIYFIRQHWDEYDKFANCARQMVQSSRKGEEELSILDNLLQTKRNWADISGLLFYLFCAYFNI